MSQNISNLPEGSIINIPINGVLQKFLLCANSGNNPYQTSDKKDIVLVMSKSTYTVSEFGGNDGVYVNNTLDIWLDRNFSNYVPYAIKTYIPTISITDETDTSLTVARKFFVLSKSNAEGANVSYFKTASHRVIGSVYYLRTTSTAWAAVWCPYKVASNGAISVGGGSADTLAKPKTVAPAFNLYANAKVSSTPNEDGSYNLLPNIYCTIGQENQGVTDAAVDSSIFLTKLSDIGDYTFVYNNDWQYNGSSVSLSEYGITAAGTPINGDTITVTIPVINRVVEFHTEMGYLGGTGKKPKSIKVEVASTGNPVITAWACNDYNEIDGSWEEITFGEEHVFENEIHPIGGWEIGVKIHAEAENSFKIFEPTAIAVLEDWSDENA